MDFTEIDLYDGYDREYGYRYDDEQDVLKEMYGDEKKLKIRFYTLENNKLIGDGYYMPDFKTFEDYALNHMEAEKIGVNKYKLPHDDYRMDRYICLEYEN